MFLYECIFEGTTVFEMLILSDKGAFMSTFVSIYKNNQPML